MYLVLRLIFYFIIPPVLIFYLLQVIMSNLLNLNIGHLNVNRVASKLADINVLLTQPTIFHIFGFTEARLDDSISDNDVAISNFTVFRRDKERFQQTGLAAYVHNSIIHLTRRRKDLETESVECMWLEVKSNKSSPLLVGILDRHPDETFPWYDEFQSMYDNVRKETLFRCSIARRLQPEFV